MIVRAMPVPAWLSAGNHDAEIIISSRIRYARNLRGHIFPVRAADYELIQIENKIWSALRQEDWQIFRPLSTPEWQFLLGSHMISPDFQYRKPGRSAGLDHGRVLAIMINEEDHLRIQAITPGWSPYQALEQADRMLAQLGESLEFAHHKSLGYLTSSESNAGTGLRASAMVHLPGLAHRKRLPNVLNALADRRVYVRGIFGETSRAVGAFFQVSITGHLGPDFIGACDYLAAEERAARSEISTDERDDLAMRASDFLTVRREVTLAECVRALSWIRLAAGGDAKRIRDVDMFLAALEVQSFADDRSVQRRRADSVRDFLGR